MARVKANPLIGSVVGRLGNLVLVDQPGGVVMRERVTPRNPQTPAQVRWRAAMAEAGRAYQTLSAEQHAGWQAYAVALAEPGERPPRTVNAFVQLAARYRMVNPDLPIPMDAPVSRFGGDGLEVEVAAEPTGVRFTGSWTNAPGVVTELLVQPLPSAFAQAYDTKFRSRGYVEFSSSTPSALVACPPGFYACAIRFVRASTGQAGGLIRVGVVRVS
jgi:hypothetical protein